MSSRLVTMARGINNGRVCKRNLYTAGGAQEAAHQTRRIGRKRVAIPQAAAALPLSLPFTTSCPNRRRRRTHPGAPNHLELLPQDVLVRILCSVNHSDLKQLIFVSKTTRDAALVAKERHFAFTTPMPRLSFNGDGCEENADACDSHEAPNAPRRISRTRPGVKDLASITVALFPSSDGAVDEQNRLIQ